MTAPVQTDQDLDALVGKALKQLRPAQLTMYRTLMRSFLRSQYARNRSGDTAETHAEDIDTACGIFDHLMTTEAAVVAHDRLADDRTSRTLIALTDERDRATELLNDAMRDLYAHEGWTIGDLVRATGLAWETVARRLDGTEPGDRRPKSRRRPPGYVTERAQNCRDSKDKLYSAVRGAIIAGRPLKQLQRETGLALATLRHRRDEVIPPT